VTQRVRLVPDDDPDAALDALAAAAGSPVVVHPAAWGPDERAAATTAVGNAPAGTWLVTFTSGSTAEPRGVARTSASWRWSVAAVAALARTGPGTRVLVPGPLSSSLFLHAAWHARAVGARPLHEPLRTGTPWDVAHVTPLQLATLLDDPTQRLAGRLVVVGGAALPPPLAAAAAAQGLDVRCYYGAAELSFVAAGHPGRLHVFPGVAVEVRDETLWVRSPGLATATVGDGAGALRRDGAGWATVGDRGRLETDGTVTVLGRSAAIVTGAAVVLPTDVERVLLEHPAVAAAVVLGLPHPTLGTVVAAVVQAGADAELDAGRLRAHCAGRLAPAQRPRRWFLATPLPSAPGGKPDRRAVAALVAAGALPALPGAARADLP
jgi:acyl-CoA synthetase (AMP-forming)/AMP-acid ligase II